MHPLQNGSQVTERPADKPVSGLPGYFTESGENNVPSYPGADWFNNVIDEFLNVINAGGAHFDTTKLNNLTKGIKGLTNISVQSVVGGNVFPAIDILKVGDVVPEGTDFFRVENGIVEFYPKPSGVVDSIAIDGAVINGTEVTFRLVRWSETLYLKDFIVAGITSVTEGIHSAFDFAVSSGSVLDFGSGTYEISEPISMLSNLSIRSNCAKFIGKPGIQGAYPYVPVGIFQAININNLKIDGLIKTEIDHNEFFGLGDAANRPTIVGFLGDNCTSCDFGKFDGFGSVNYSYTPNFVEYGIFDLRNSNDCIVEVVNANGRYGDEPLPPATPSTLGVAGRNNLRCHLIRPNVKNTYWSGLSWNGTDCKVVSPTIRNTKGSNLNLSGANCNAYDVDLKGTQQGNISIGEGGADCFNCNVYGGIAGDAQFSNCTLSKTTQYCHVNLKGYGWGQEGSAQLANVGVRVQGKNNYVVFEGYKTLNGYVSNGDACNVLSDTLNAPTAEGNEIHIKGYGAKTLIRAPRTIINVTTKNFSGTGLEMGYRCAGSEIRHVRAENCDRPITYGPNLSDPADYAQVRLGKIVSVDCVQDSILPLLDRNITDRVIDTINSSNSDLKLDDILYALKMYTNHASLPAKSLAAMIEFICTDAYGTAYGTNIMATTISSGSLVESLVKLRYGSIEVDAHSGSTSYIAQSSDGVKYALTPPIGGGPATWTPV